MTKSEIEKEIHGRFLTLRKILNSWDLIPNSPKDEFDSLNRHILSYLYKGADLKKITRIIDSELKVNYGLSPEIDDAEKFATEIIDWWSFENPMNEV